MPKPRTFTPQEQATFAEMYLAGRQEEEIREALRCGYASFVKLERIVLSTNPTGKETRAKNIRARIFAKLLPAAAQEEIVRKFNDFQSIRGLAQEYGVDTEVIRRLIRRQPEGSVRPAYLRKPPKPPKPKRVSQRALDRQKRAMRRENPLPKLREFLSVAESWEHLSKLSGVSLSMLRFYRNVAIREGNPLVLLKPSDEHLASQAGNDPGRFTFWFNECHKYDFTCLNQRK